MDLQVNLFDLRIIKADQVLLLDSEESMLIGSFAFASGVGPHDRIAQSKHWRALR